MHTVFIPAYDRTKEITAALVAAGLDAKAFDPGEEDYPNLGVFVTDPREPKVLWEFSPSDTEGDKFGWNYQIGASVGDDYEGIIFENLSESLAHDAPAKDVAREIQKVIEVGIDNEDMLLIIAAHTAMHG